MELGLPAGSIRLEHSVFEMTTADWADDAVSPWGNTVSALRANELYTAIDTDGTLLDDAYQPIYVHAEGSGQPTC